MYQPNKSISLSPIYELRKNFTLIGLTGRTGSGCSTIANQLSKGFCEDYPHWGAFNISHNSYRKYRIVYEFARENFAPFKVISYKNVLLLFVFKSSFTELLDFLESKGSLYSDEILLLKDHEEQFNLVHQGVNNIKWVGDPSKTFENLERLNNYFFNDSDFISLCATFSRIFSETSNINKAVFFQQVSNNLRNSGAVYKDTTRVPLIRVFTIVKVINLIVKAYSAVQKQAKERTQLVVDSLRNPLEIMYFKQRYAAFYMIAINRDASERDAFLREKYQEEYGDLSKIFDDEYNGSKQEDFFKQNVAECIQKADIHLSVLSPTEIEEFNSKLFDPGKTEKDYTTPKFTWQMQLLKYMALIFQPGIIPPSPEERCMQIAYAAKVNSGCISRQVGAVVTDETYAVKSIGWNNTPGGQVPCVLRNGEDLMNDKGDLAAFTPFERNLEKNNESNQFRAELIKHFSNFGADVKMNLEGRNVCFCFKSIKNACSEGKNQVHTRSLHAEEHAFMQIAKNGGSAVKGGKLFTTASPCELCSKKAYHLGIKVIYYVDPYPGISQKQILEGGSPERNPEVRLFNGAIGNAYHWLYEPILGYKDEQKLIIGHQIDDLTKKQENELKLAKERVWELETKIAELLTEKGNG